MEKNIVPEIADEYRGRKLDSKGFKKIVVNNFPIHDGQKTKLVFLSRVCP